MLTHRRGGDPERAGQLAGASGLAREQLDGPTPGRIGQRGERVVDPFDPPVLSRPVLGHDRLAEPLDAASVCASLLVQGLCRPGKDHECTQGSHRAAHERRILAYAKRSVAQLFQIGRFCHPPPLSCNLATYPGPGRRWYRRCFMERLTGTIATAAALFVGTNLDDIVVLAVLSLSSRIEGRPRRWQIWAGQYAGVCLLVGASLLAAFGLTLLPENCTWLLGFVPLGLGLYKLIVELRAKRSDAAASTAVATGLGGVTAVTVANGGDNVAVYTPVFRTSSAGDIAVTIGVFAGGVAVWCVLGSWLVSHRRISEVLGRWSHWMVPAVFILIGLGIFYKAGVVGF